MARQQQKQMQHSDENVEMKQQQFQHIINQLKQWYKENSIHFEVSHGDSLLKIVFEVYKKWKKQAQEYKKDKQFMKQRVSLLSSQLLDAQRTVVTSKQTIEKHQYQIKQMAIRNEQQFKYLQIANTTINNQKSIKITLEDRIIQLQSIISEKDSEINSLNQIILKLKNQANQYHEKDERIKNSYESIKKECQNYKLDSKKLITINEELLGQVKMLKQLVEKAKQFHSYCSIIKSQNSVENSSIDGQMHQRENLQFLKQNQFQKNDKKQKLDIVKQESNQKDKFFSDTGPIYERASPKCSEASQSFVSVRSNSQLSISCFKNKNYQNICKSKNIQDNKRKTEKLYDRKKSQYQIPSNYLGKNDQNEPSANRSRQINYTIKIDRQSMSEAKPILNDIKKKQTQTILKQRQKVIIQDNLQAKNQYYRKVIKDKQRQIIRIKLQKEFLLAQSLAQEQNYIKQIHKFQKIYREKIGELLMKQRENIYNDVKQKINQLIQINIKISQQKDDLLKQKEQEFQKRLKFQMIMEQSESNFQIGRQTQRINLSEEVDLQNDKRYQLNDQVLKGKILQDNQENQQSIQSKPQSISVQVQTDDIFYFSNQNQARKLGFVRYYCDDEQIQTISRQNKEDVGVQVHFTQIQVSVQTQLTENSKFIFSNIEKSLQTDKTLFDGIDGFSHYYQSKETQIYHNIKQQASIQAEDIHQKVYKQKQKNQGQKYKLLKQMNNNSTNTITQQHKQVQTLKIIQIQAISYDIQTIFQQQKASQTDKSTFKTKKKQLSEQALYEKSSQTQQNNLKYNKIIFSQDKYYLTKYIQKYDYGTQLNINQQFQPINNQSLQHSRLYYHSIQQKIGELCELNQFDQKQLLETSKFGRTNDKTIINDLQFSNFKKQKTIQNNNFFEFSKQKDQNVNNNLSKQCIKLFEDINNITPIQQINQAREQNILNRQEPQINKKLYTNQCEPIMILQQLNDSIESKLFQFERNVEDNSIEEETFDNTFAKKQQENKKQDSDTDCESLIAQVIGIKKKKLVKEQLFIPPKTIQKNKVYFFEAKQEQNSKIIYNFMIWENGIYCVNNKTYLKVKQKAIACIDPQMFILGNSQLVIRGNLMWIRRKTKHSYLEGNMRNGNWIASNYITYLIN